MTKVTSAVCPFVDDAVRFPGHEIVGASGVGVGLVGDPPHACGSGQKHQGDGLSCCDTRPGARIDNGPRVPLSRNLS